MTADEFRSWLDKNFPGHNRRGGDSALAAAARALGITSRSVQRKRDGKQPITVKDKLMIALSWKGKAEIRAAELNCTWDIYHGIVTLDAPAGHVFRGTGTHAVACGDLSQLSEDEVYRGAFNDMAMGVELCTEAACDICSA
jgi:hypothetical protein